MHRGTDGVLWVNPEEYKTEYETAATQTFGEHALRGQGGSMTTNDLYAATMRLYGISPISEQQPTATLRPGPAPSKDILFREPIKLSANDKRRKLALDAKEKLGYSLLFDEKFAAEQLDEVLFMLDIAPLNEAAVLDYQKKMVEAKGGQATVTRAGWKWAMNSLDSRNGGGTAVKIPDSIIEKCVLIKDAMPEANFFVETCQYDPDPFVGVWIRVAEGSLNPFTGNIVGRKEIKRYLWVFDEPGFDVLESQVRTVESGT